MAINERKPEPLNDARVAFLLARYTALREEMQNRYSQNYQMISLNLTISAAIITYGLQPGSAVSVLFLVPIISMFLGMVTTHNYLYIKQLRMIIDSEIETEFNFTSHVPALPIRIYSSSLILAGVGGVFVLVQLLALVLGLLWIQEYTTLDTVLIVLDILAILIAFWLTIVVIRVQKSSASPVQKTG